MWHHSLPRAFKNTYTTTTARLAGTMLSLCWMGAISAEQQFKNLYSTEESTLGRCRDMYMYRARGPRGLWC